MLHRRSETLVTEFLGDALALGALGVPELEAKARAAGLLGEGQQISHARVFKRAKRSLGIKSLRAGFGARSQWLWQLPAPERRVPIPSDWLEGGGCLEPDRPPHDAPPH